MMGLADIVREIQKDRQQPVISRRLYEGLRDGWMESRTRAYDDTDDDGQYPGLYFRASELHILCPRMVALARRQPIVQVHQVEDLWIFGLGHGYHRALQGALSTLLNGVFRGWWERDGVVVKGPNGTPCARPDGKGWKYTEVQVVNRKLQFRGHMDGALHWPDRQEILEIKSINSMMMDRINPAQRGQPLDHHITQANGYMLEFNYDRARIVYVTKTSDPLNLCMFEHEIQRDETRCKGIKQLLVECGQARLLGSRDRLPDRLPACVKASCARVHACPIGKRCFKAL